MNVTVHVAIAALAFAVACGGTTTDAGGGDAGPAGPCSFTSGTYTEHLALTSDAGPNTYCAEVPDETLTLSGSESYSGFVESGATDGGCSGGFDSTTCTFSEHCTDSTTNGGTFTISIDFTVENSAASGSEVLTITVPSGSPSTCSYTLTIAKS